MAQLKLHLLREIAIDICERQCSKNASKIKFPPSFDKFILAGKEPSHVFRRIVEDYVTITSVTSDRVHMTYYSINSVFFIHGIYGPPHHKYSWWFSCDFLNNLFLKWTRKLSLQDTDWLNDFPLTGYSKVMAENNGLEELEVYDDGTNHDWVTILKMFPKLFALHVTTQNLSSLLPIASTELAFLEEVVLKNHREDLAAAHQALYDNQSKCPNLETIRYLSLKPELPFPENATIPSVKHITVNYHIPRCCTPWDFAFLTDAQKAFPALESVEPEADVSCNCLCRKDGNLTQKLKIIDSFYEAFQSLNFGFTIKFTFRELIVISREQQNDELYSFFITKGKVSVKSDTFTVKTSYPGKQLIYEVTIRRRYPLECSWEPR